MVEVDDVAKRLLGSVHGINRGPRLAVHDCAIRSWRRKRAKLTGETVAVLSSPAVKFSVVGLEG